MDESTAADMDGGWKQVIEDYLEDFFRFFFPAVHAEIDFSHPCEHLDKELAKIMLDAAVGDREADQLIQVHWRDGGDELVLVHVEVQAQDAANFAERMYVYNTRHRDDVLKLFRFMDYVLRLTEVLSIRFDADLAQLEENLHMPYVTSIERHALQRGREEGRQEGREEGIREGMIQGAADLLRQALEVRFGEVPEALLEKIRQCQDVAVLRTLHTRALTAESLEDLQL